MTPEQRHKLQIIASMLRDGECEDHIGQSYEVCPLRPHNFNLGYEMSIDDAFDTASAAIRLVREVLKLEDEEPQAPTAVDRRDSRLARRTEDSTTEQECDDCGKMATEIVGCPDGAEICRPCFDKGNH